MGWILNFKFSFIYIYIYIYFFFFYKFFSVSYYLPKSNHKMCKQTLKKNSACSLIDICACKYDKESDTNEHIHIHTQRPNIGLCVCQNQSVEILISIVMVFGGGAFGVIRLWRWDPHDGICVLTEKTGRPHFLSLLLSIWEHRKKVAVCKPGREPSPGTESAGY